MITKEQITNLVHSFYIKVDKDELLSPIFNDIAEVNWEKHKRNLILFWCAVLLDIKEYHGRPHQQHVALMKKTDKINSNHFCRWLELFEKEVRNHIKNRDDVKLIMSKAKTIAKALSKSMKIRLKL